VIACQNRERETLNAALLKQLMPELLYYHLQKNHSRVKETSARHEEIFLINKENHPEIFHTSLNTVFKKSQKY
jgi:hypothetical protein